MQSPVPLSRDVVLIGGGHTHALVLRHWGMRPVPGARLTLIDPGVTAAYSGMLPGHIAGHYRRDDLDIDLVRLARFAGARLVMDSALGLDLEARRVMLSGRPPVSYDLVSVDIGITSGMADVPGFSDNAVPAKPLAPFADRWARFRDKVAGSDTAADVVIIGGGVAGVEVALSVAHALDIATTSGRSVTVVDRSVPLSALMAGTRRVLLDKARALGVTILSQAEVTRVRRDGVELADGRTLPSDLTVGAAGARPHDWIATTGLAVSDGFIDVDGMLRSTSHPEVYATGDCAHFSPDPRPKAGVYAVRQAPVLLHNLRADLVGSQRRVYRPQRDYLKLVSLGRKEALGDKFGLRLSGHWVWRLKDRIDRAFMDKFARYPAMAAPRLPTDVALGVRDQVPGGQPMCGGCGAKVGPGVLAGMIGADTPLGRPDVVRVKGDDAAELLFGKARQVISTDHLRAFTLDPWMMGRVAAVHALGDVWAMAAAPQAALAQIILPRMSERMQAATLAEITHGARTVLDGAGAELVGGHTSLGSELTVGFTVTGLPHGRSITLAGARPGDQLILTKPIGSGTILAAEMQMKARGTWVATALEEMARPSGKASDILQQAHAMTDVTGFGLAGHLMGMMRASGVRAVVDCACVPFLDGAPDLAAQGVRSTLAPANARIPGLDLPDTPEGKLLVDPQTAGGLLASVGAGDCDAMLAALRAADYQAARIGRVEEGAPGVRAS